MYYLACPNPECKKKVAPSIDGKSYHCLNCKRSYLTCIPTYMFTAKVADFTDSLLITFPRENGVPVMGGLTAQ